jgi:SAM-dependent methyltransferase
MKVSLYEEAAIYDILHWPGTRAEVSGILRTARRFLPAPPRTFLEPACGSGRYLRVLASRGFHVTGFDLLDPMVEHAARTVRAAAAKVSPRPRVSIFKGDMRTFARHVKPASIDVAFNPINSIRHLSSDAAMLAHFGQVARTLRTGGVYIVGLSLSAYGMEGITEDVWIGARGGTRVTQVVTYFPPKGPGRGRDRDERVHSHLTIDTRKGQEHKDATYVLRAYNLEQWRRLVERSDLQLVASVDEQGRDHTAAEPGYCIFVLAARARRVTRRSRRG